MTLSRVNGNESSTQIMKLSTVANAQAYTCFHLSCRTVLFAAREMLSSAAASKAKELQHLENHQEKFI